MFLFPKETETVIRGVVIEILKRQPQLLLPEKPLTDLGATRPAMLCHHLVRWIVAPFESSILGVSSQLRCQLLEVLSKPSTVGPIFPLAVLETLIQERERAQDASWIDKFVQIFQVANSSGYIERGDQLVLLKKIGTRTKLLEAVLALVENQMC